MIADRTWPPQDLLAPAACVHVGRVEHVDPAVERLTTLPALASVDLAPNSIVPSVTGLGISPYAQTEESCSSITSNCEAL
jgi:hypothetical protein